MPATAGARPAQIQELATGTQALKPSLAASGGAREEQARLQAELGLELRHSDRACRSPKHQMPGP